MTARERVIREVDSLVAAIGRGELDQEGVQRLEALVLTDDAARRRYIVNQQLYASLEWELAAPSEIAGVQPSPGGMLTEAPKSAPQRAKLVAPFMRLASQLQRPASFSSISAAALLFAGLTLLALFPQGSKLAERPQAPSGQVEKEKESVAYFTAAETCRWAGAEHGLQRRILANQTLELLEGTAEISFAPGASVVLEGPSTFIVQTPGSGHLVRGRLVAHVPASAVGFVVTTPVMQVRDLGTEFGVIAQHDGTSEVHVLAGVVELISPTLAEPMVVSAGSAQRVSSAATTGAVNEVRCEPQRFVRAVAGLQRLRTAAQEEALTRLPALDRLQLWLAADGGVNADASGKVTIWRNLAPQADFRTSLAWQYLPERQPTWAKDHPSFLHFEGGQFLNLPLPSELKMQNSSYEMFFVARSSAREIQFLIAGGTGGGGHELHLNGESGARFIPCAPFTLLTSSDQGASEQFVDGAWRLFNARLETEHGFVAALSVDGQEPVDPGEGDARYGGNEPLQIGRRADDNFHLQGEIAEVLIYAPALSVEERNTVADYLNRKYSLPATTSGATDAKTGGSEKQSF